jgi:hypothetical protein
VPACLPCPCLQLEAAKAKLSVVTGMHVYSVQPGVPKVGLPAWLAGPLAGARWAAQLAACLHTAPQAAAPGRRACGAGLLAALP